MTGQAAEGPAGAAHRARDRVPALGAMQVPQNPLMPAVLVVEGNCYIHTSDGAWTGVDDLVRTVASLEHALVVRTAMSGQS